MGCTGPDPSDPFLAAVDHRAPVGEMSAKKQLRTIDKTSSGFHVDDLYEFSAPKFFDFSANMKESGSLIDEKSDHGHDWFGTKPRCLKLIFIVL